MALLKYIKNTLYRIRQNYWMAAQGYYWQQRYSSKAESSSSRLETHLSSKIFLITSILHIFSSSIVWYFMDYGQWEITKSDILYFPESINIHLKFLPVTDLASCSIAESSMFRTGFVDFLIDWIIHKNLLTNVFLRCSFPDRGSMRYLWVARGKTIFTLILLL